MNWREPVIRWALKQVKGQSEEVRHALIIEAVKHCFNTISSEDILRFDGVWKFDGKEISPQQIEVLQAQAETLQGMFLWKVLRKDIEYQLNKKMFLEEKITMDVMWGQLITYLFDIINTRLKQLSKLK